MIVLYTVIIIYDCIIYGFLIKVLGCSQIGLFLNFLHPSGITSVSSNLRDKFHYPAVCVLTVSYLVSKPQSR